MTPAILTNLSWLAIVLLSTSYWFQVYKIHKHKEVRDLSIWTFVQLAVGFCILVPMALHEGSTIFLVKQFASLVPVSILIFQIMKHKKDHWHDDSDTNCSSCRNELEEGWCWCPYCGNANAACNNGQEDLHS
jgi:uncharacterized protein with PQ loop repeat